MTLALTDAGFIAAGWLAAAGLVGAYALFIVRRGRHLSPRVPPEKRRWS
jgi:hypothetical protein